MRLLALLLFSALAHADPWVVYGQTAIGGYGIDNPTPNQTGVIGEVAVLPFRVPDGKVLRIDGIGMESHSIATETRPVFVLFPWVTNMPVVGTPAIRVRSALLSCTGSTHTISCPVQFTVPAGKWVNLRLICQSPAMFTTVVGWHVYGELEDATKAAW